jgi:hypothetical protein
MQKCMKFARFQNFELFDLTMSYKYDELVRQCVPTFKYDDLVQLITIRFKLSKNIFDRFLRVLTR